MQKSRSAFNFPRDSVTSLLLVSNSQILCPLQEVPGPRVRKHLLWNRHPQVFMNVNREVEKTMPNAVWFPPPACGVGCVIGGGQGVPQLSQPLSLSLKPGVLPVATTGFSLVPRVKSWSNRFGRCYTKEGLWGQNGLMFLPGIAIPCCPLLLLLIGSTGLLGIQC